MANFRYQILTITQNFGSDESKKKTEGQARAVNDGEIVHQHANEERK